MSKTTDRIWDAPGQKLMSEMTPEDWKCLEDHLKEKAAQESSSVVEVKTQPGGRCTRCGRALARSFMVNGVAYGPICVKKLFGVTVSQTSSAPCASRIQDMTQQMSLEEYLEQ